MPVNDVSAATTLANTFNFHITLTRSGGGDSRNGTASPTDPPAQLGDGGFQECSGLDLEMDVQELIEGGRNNAIVRRVGRGKYSDIVLKRGMFYAPGGRIRADLWNWLSGILAGTRPVPRYNGRVDMYDHAGERTGVVVASWTFDRGLPKKISGPQLNAKTGEIAIEELTIAHEGLRLVVGA